MQSPSNEELGLDENGFPPMDETGNVSLHQVRANLLLTYEQRLQNHFQWMKFIDRMRAAGKKHYGLDTRIAEAIG